MAEALQRRDAPAAAGKCRVNRSHCITTTDIAFWPEADLHEPLINV
jgi:hypothetical protein